LLTLVVFVAASVTNAAAIDGVKGDSALELSALVLLIACFAVGWVIGSWAAGGLALVPVFAAVPFGELSVDRGDVFGYAWVFAMWETVALVPALLVGTGLGKLARRNSSQA
jgi:hypothetical protein